MGTQNSNIFADREESLKVRITEREEKLQSQLVLLERLKDRGDALQAIANRRTETEDQLQSIEKEADDMDVEEAMLALKQEEVLDFATLKKRFAEFIGEPTEET